MSWWDFGEWSGFQGAELATYRIACAFCGEKGNFETIAHLERKKPGDGILKVLNYDTLKCGHCGNYTLAFWSAASSGGASGMHNYIVLPQFQSTTTYPEHWPQDVGNCWLEARRSIEGKNWTAAAVMARSAIQLVARYHKAQGKNLKEEIDDLAAKGLILPTMQEWAHEVRELGNEGAHPKPGSARTKEKDAKDVVQFLSFLMSVLYDLPKQIEDYRKRKA